MKSTVQNLTKLVFASILVVAVSACVTPSNSPTVYGNGQGQVMGEAQVSYATVQAVRNVTIQNPNSNLGGAAGAALGAIGASSIGKGRGSAIAGILGGVIGSIAGQHLESQIDRQEGLEITVLYPDGRQSVIVQARTVPIQAGQKVQIIKGPDGNARVLPAS